VEESRSGGRRSARSPHGPELTVTGLDPTLERALDLVGVFVFALSGASLAARKRFDVVGMLVLAMATGLGGGILRDVLLGDVPPVALRHQPYLAVPIVAALVVLVGHQAVERMWRPVLVFDAAGLGLFSVVGTAKALDHGLAVLPSVLLGVTTAVGGGMLRDVLAREVPSVFRADSALYATPAALGAGATAVLWSSDHLGALGAVGIVAAVLIVRVVAMRRDWRAPTARGGAA
jgi:uncharacterized membrane protein YeiH